MLFRLLLKKAPKAISYALWSVVAFRLLIPYSFESMFSLIPHNTNAIPISQNVVYQQKPQINSAITAVNSFVNETQPAPSAESANRIQIIIEIGAYIWIAGIISMLIYCIVSFFIIKGRLKYVQLIEKNIYKAVNIRTPFVLGILRPRIYLPIGLSKEESRFILLHEQTHIRRKDHIIKALAFLLMSFHWFNPLVWVAFILMSMDMELSCDESVLKVINEDIKKPYAASLLSLAAGRHILNGNPTSFGEGNIKRRIENVLNYKRPRLYVILAAVIITVLYSISLLANPDSPNSGKISKTSDTSVREIQVEITQPDSRMITGRIITDKDGYKAGDIVNVFISESVSYDVASLVKGDWIDIDYKSVMYVSPPKFEAVKINRITGDNYPTSFTKIENGEIVKSNTLYNSRIASEMPALILSGSPESSFKIENIKEIPAYMIIDIGATGDKVYYTFEQDGKYYVGQDYMHEITRTNYDMLLQYIDKNEITKAAQQEMVDVNYVDINYVEETYNFTFEIPSDWQGKYKIIQKADYISFVYSEELFAENEYQEFFGIVVMPKEDYELLLKDEPFMGSQLAELNDKAYVLYTPLDMAINDPQKAEEYNRLYLSGEQIKERFKLT
jgi:beta-lactamase regulating signal transducer with metallopeptidase domain